MHNKHGKIDEPSINSIYNKFKQMPGFLETYFLNYLNYSKQLQETLFKLVFIYY